jgi:hypothetical protein
MAKTIIELVKDVWNYGCKGDVIGVEKEGLAALDALATKLKSEPLYKVVVADASKVASDVKSAAARAEAAVEAEVSKIK